MNRPYGPEWCWACDEWIGLGPAFGNGDCPECRAPYWLGRFSTLRVEGAGVYFLEAECGLWKVGVSATVARRSEVLIRKAARRGATVRYAGCLPGAGYPVEQWLHEVFADVRDRHGARSEGLPHPTEWFWPSLGFQDLTRGAALRWERVWPEDVDEAPSAFMFPMRDFEREQLYGSEAA